MDCKTSIVILNWNGSNMLKKFLPSVLACSANAEVVVADNASTDGSLDLLRSSFPEVRLIVLDRNYGFAEGYNKALEQVKAQYYVLLNSDVEVGEGWLQPLVAFLDKHADYCACQPKLRAYHAPDSFEYAGASGGFLDRYGYPFCRGRLFSTVEKDEGQYDTITDVLWATGACLVIRSDDYWRAGGLDARFFAHNEEIDLCWRLRLAGRRIACVPESTVWHVGGGTLPKSNPMKTYLNFRNNLTMLYKNLSEQELKKVMRVRRVLDYVAALQMLLTGKPREMKAVIKARRDFAKWKPLFRQDRLLIQNSRKVDSIAEIYPGSLLACYYLRGKKLFSQLKWGSRLYLLSVEESRYFLYKTVIVNMLTLFIHTNYFSYWS